LLIKYRWYLIELKWLLVFLILTLFLQADHCSPNTNAAFNYTGKNQFGTVATFTLFAYTKQNMSKKSIMTSESLVMSLTSSVSLMQILASTRGL